MQIGKQMVITGITTLMLLPIGLQATSTTAKASYLGDKTYIAKTKFPKRMVGTYRCNTYDSAKSLHAKHGQSHIVKVKITRNGKGSYYQSWSGTKKNSFSHPFKQKFNAVYRTKEKGYYALMPSGKHKKNKKYIGLVDTTWLKRPKIFFLMYDGKYHTADTISPKTKFTF